MEEERTSRESSSSRESIGYPMDDRVLHASTSLLMMSETPDERYARHNSMLYGLNCRLAFAVTSAAFGSVFQHGYNTGVVNAPEKIIEEWIENIRENRTEFEVTKAEVTLIWSVAVSIFCIGGIIGGSVVGLVADNIGRKKGLLYNNAVAIIGAACEGSSKYIGSYELLIFGRLVVGINSGITAGLVPVYLTEISPVALRGAVGTVYQLVITISIMISQILGLNSILGTEDKWPHLFFITFIPALLQLVMLPLCPESPKQVLKVTHNELKAKQVLVWLRGSLDVHAELEEMKDELEAERSEAKASLRELLTNRSLRIPLIISCMLMIAQQLSGINIVTYYSTKIFHQAQLSNDAAQYATLAVGIMNVLATLVSLALVEKSGRKTLLIIGFGGMFFSTVLLTFCLANVEMIFVTYLSIGAVLLFVIFFSMGPGSIPWFITTELFNHNARPTATSVAVSINWASNFLVGIGFLPLAALWDYYVFLLFAAIQAVFVIFIYKKVPETRNKTTEEISALFR